MTDRDDQRLIDEIKQSYQPDPLSPTGRAALRARIEERAGKRPSWLAIPAAGGVLAASAALWWLFMSPTAPTPSAPSFDWEQALYEELANDIEADGFEDVLPGDYAMIDAYLDV
jgi:hypothetical protein